jgi:hypothetical protein
MDAAPTFEDLVAEGASVPVEGWDFSWFEGRATEERPPWGYSRLLAERMASATAALEMRFYDIAAVVVFLRIWTVPGFAVDGYRPQLAELHERILADGSFTAHSQRFLIEARKPG